MQKKFIKMSSEYDEFEEIIWCARVSEAISDNMVNKSEITMIEIWF